MVKPPILYPWVPPVSKKSNPKPRIIHSLRNLISSEAYKNAQDLDQTK